MSRIALLNQRYTASASLVRNGVEVIAVGDPLGAVFDGAARQLLRAARDDGPGLWDELVGAVKALRWRLVTHPQPLAHNPAVRDGADQVALQARRLRGAVANDAMLDAFAAAAGTVAGSDPPHGATLLRSIEEVGAPDCVVVAASKAAQAGLDCWLAELGVRVTTASELEREQLRVEQAYVAGPPRFFRASLVTAPTTNAVSFLMPAWFSDRSVPRSVLAAYAEGAIRITARLFTEGDVTAPPGEASATDIEDDFLPQPMWGTRQSPDREPTSDEVVAHKVLLSGSRAMWLDDGERIRTLDPEQPAGERVTYTEVASVRPGTYMLLREGETERGALYAAALRQIGARGTQVHQTQRAWKNQLTSRLLELGYRAVVRELAARGVTTADRARAWTDPNLVRPHSDRDFELVLEWLGIPTQPTFGQATMLRRAIYQASQDVREQLESAVAGHDLSVLERDGHLSLDVELEGFRGIIATRVLAISPHTEIVSRHDARVPFGDRSGQWLE